MRIVFVANFLPDTNYTRDLSVELVSIISNRDSLFLCGRKNEKIRDGKLPKVDLIWKRGILFFLPILKYITNRRPDIVHFQHEFKTYGGVISGLIFPLFIGVMRLLGYKVLVTFHGIVSKKQLSELFLESFGLKNNSLNILAVSIFLDYTYKLTSFVSNNIIVHTSFMKKILIREYRINNKKTLIIPHGVRKIIDLKTNIKYPKLFNRFPTLRGKKIIIVFGYFSPRKGYEVVIEAFSRLIQKNSELRDWMLVIAGDVKIEFKDYKNKIKKLVKSKKIDNNVLITGFVDAQDIDEFYRISKIALIPAMFSISTSGALAMTLAYKKPLLAANAKPLADEIQEENFGILYNLFSLNSCVSQLQRLMIDDGLRRQLSERLKRTVPPRYWNRIAAQHYSLYKKMR